MLYHSRRWIDLDLDSLVKEYSQGLSAAVLAKKFGVGRTTVLSRLRRMGVSIRRPSEWEEKKVGLDSDGLEFLTEIVDGLLLGDGTLQLGSLKVDQIGSRVEWLTDIQNRLNSIGVKSIITPVVRPSRVRKDGKVLPEYHGFQLRTPAYIELRQHTLRWYASGIKRVPSDVRVTPMSLADWVCGDGLGTPHGMLILCTDGFSEACVRFLVSRLVDTFGIRPRFMGSSNRPRIGILRKGDVFLLKKVLSPFLPSCCTYKFSCARLPQQRGLFTPDEVRDIRNRCTRKEPLRSIADSYKVSRSAISNISLRKSYSCVD